MTEAVPTDPPHADGADDASSRMTSPGSVETALDTGSEAGAESSGGAEGERDVIAELAMLPAMRRAMLVGSLTTAERHELHDRWARWAHRLSVARATFLAGVAASVPLVEVRE